MTLNDLSIARRLRYTWSPFFQRFKELTPIQRRAIPEILSGRDVFVVAPTATGKTEAVVAPLAERLKDESWKPTSVLYISPTRALVNDARKRIQWPLQAIGVSVARRTGDHHEYGEDSQDDIILTTPESFDSLLVRMPHKLKHTKAVILDEIHLIDNTVRGDQLRLCLERLRRIRDEAEEDMAQVIGLSATISRPEDVGNRYAENPSIVMDESKRDIDITYVSLWNPDWPTEVYEILVENSVRKALVFCNRKVDCEDISRHLNIGIFRGNVLVHHGDLSKSTREHVEHVMNLEGNVAICVATTTLEVGIDIGDVDGVILHRPPSSVSSFLQRIGRGCRRRGDATRVICLTHGPLDELIFKVLGQEAASGRGDIQAYLPKYSVLVQQVLSYLMQHRDCRRKKDSVLSLCRMLVDDPTSDAVLDSMIDKKLVGMKGTTIVPGEKAPGPDSPLLHGNIVGSLFSDGIGVRDADTGKTIGWIGEEVDMGVAFRLAGSDWQALRWEGGDLVAARSGLGPSLALKARSKSMPLYSLSLACAIKKDLFRVGKSTIMIRKSRIGTAAFHGLGSVTGAFVRYLLQARGISVGGWNELSGVAIPEFPSNWNQIGYEDVSRIVNKRWRAFEGLLTLGKFSPKLASELRTSNIAEYLEARTFIEFVRSLRLQTMTDSQLESLRDLGIL